MKRKKKIFEILSIDNVIGIVGHLLAIVSLLLVFATLVEMQKQRDNSYMPQIVAECSDEVGITWSNKHDILYISDDEKKSSRYKQFYLDIYNIGVGVAKNLQFEWVSENMDLFAECINSNSKNYYLESKNGIFNLQTEGVVTGGSEFEKVNKLSFLASSNDEPYRMIFPHQYLLCYKVMLMDQLNTFPQLQLKISYEDIQNKSYEQILNIRMEPQTLFSSSEDKDEDFIGSATLNFIVQ